jgi:hypothetical protein
MINGNAHSRRGGQELVSRPVSLSRSVIGSAGLAVGYSAQIDAPMLVKGGIWHFLCVISGILEVEW